METTSPFDDADEFVQMVLSAPERTWHVPPGSQILYGDGTDPWRGMTVTSWED